MEDLLDALSRLAPGQEITVEFARTPPTDQLQALSVWINNQLEGKGPFDLVGEGGNVLTIRRSEPK